MSAPCHDGKNIAPVLLPLRRKEVEATPRDGVIGRRLLGGFRGRVRGDIPAVANAIWLSRHSRKPTKTVWSSSMSIPYWCCPKDRAPSP